MGLGWEKVPSRYRGLLSERALADLAQFPADWPELELLPLAASTVPVKRHGRLRFFHHSRSRSLVAWKRHHPID